MGKMVQRRRFGETNWETDREAVYRWIWVEGFRGGGGGDTLPIITVCREIRG